MHACIKIVAMDPGRLTVVNTSTGFMLLLISILMLPGGALAHGLQLNPSAACDFLAEEGLRTRGGYSESGNVYRCSSRRRSLASSGRVPNSIRYIATGDAQMVSGLRLELRVQPGSSMQRAHRQLVNYSKSLIEKSLGMEMPEEIEAAILSATTGTWKAGNSTISLERIVAGQSGYELRLIIR